jgi:predicted lipoprotein
MARILLFTLLVLGVSAHAAKVEQAAVPGQAYERTVADFVLPGFDRLSEQADRHEAAWVAYCREPGPQAMVPLKGSFHALADAWAAIEMIRSGPAAEDFRHERFSFWPERKNAVERGLSNLLKRPDPASLTAADIRKESAAVQGLPALERLIHADDPPDEIRCSLGKAISANAAGLASEIADAWRARPATASPEARAMLATDIVTFYAIIKDRKIEAVIGKAQDQVKPRAAEFWRSARSMRGIQQNLEALERINAALFPVASENFVLPFATRTAADVARSLAGDFAALAAGPERHKVILLRDAVNSAEDRAAIDVPAALGVTIGFNSLDGD